MAESTYKSLLTQPSAGRHEPHEQVIVDDQLTFTQTIQTLKMMTHKLFPSSLKLNDFFESFGSGPFPNMEINQSLETYVKLFLSLCCYLSVVPVSTQIELFECVLQSDKANGYSNMLRLCKYFKDDLKNHLFPYFIHMFQYCVSTLYSDSGSDSDTLLEYILLFLDVSKFIYTKHEGIRSLIYELCSNTIERSNQYNLLSHLLDFPYIIDTLCELNVEEYILVGLSNDVYESIVCASKLQRYLSIHSCIPKFIEDDSLFIAINKALNNEEDTTFLVTYSTELLPQFSIKIINSGVASSVVNLLYTCPYRLVYSVASFITILLELAPISLIDSFVNDQLVERIHDLYEDLPDIRSKYQLTECLQNLGRFSKFEHILETDDDSESV